MNVSLEFLLLAVAFFAKDRSAFFWLEWNFAFFAAFSACCLVHFTWPKIPSLTESATLIKPLHIVFLLGS